MKTINNVVLAIFLGAVVASCASTQQLTQQEIQQQYPAVTKLEQSIETARQNNVALYAPEGFATAEQQLQTAYTAGKRDQKDAVDKATNAGKIAIDQANKNASSSREILAEVVQARDKAIGAGANELFPADLTKLDKQLGEASNLIERNNVEKAKQIRPGLRQAYSDLELLTLKEGTVQRAENAIQHARENNAPKLAPKTFSAAEESLALANSLLQADRLDRKKADEAATRATVLADRSNNIAELIKDFDRRDFKSEDIVLWYQDQLAAATAPLEKDLLFNEANKATIGALNKDITGLMEDRKQLAVANQQLAAANRQLAGKTAELTAAQQEREQKFNSVQRMYSPEEAEVYRQQDNVLISVHGVTFPSGSSEIEPHSFALMNKLIKSIETFDNPMVQIIGHTDATGSDETNKKLSEQRANSVARFLSDVGGYPENRIQAQGMGAEKPVASNATPEGRAQNRRIDVLIINQPQ